MEPEPNGDDALGGEAALLRALVLDEYGTPPARAGSNSGSSASDPRSSDEEEQESGAAGGAPPQPPRDADPLYDAHADSEDEAWVAQNLIRRPQRRAQPPPESRDAPSPASSTATARGADAGKKDRAPDTNFQLACPSCFALLCLQCQPHESYEGQFRAVFVQNCVTKIGETLRVRVTNGARTAVADKRDVYRPVACRACGTEVAVRDADDVYHFCNVVY